MCSQPLNDKGYLRQYMPDATHDQIVDFVESTGKRLDHLPRPTPQQTDAARYAAYRELIGFYYAS